MVTEPDKVGTPQYWMNAGVVKLVRDIEFFIENQGKG